MKVKNAKQAARWAARFEKFSDDSIIGVFPMVQGENEGHVHDFGSEDINYPAEFFVEVEAWRPSDWKAQNALERALDRLRVKFEIRTGAKATVRRVGDSIDGHIWVIRDMADGQ